MENDINTQIITHIKEKKELQALDDHYVTDLIKKYDFKIDEKYTSFKQLKRSKVYQELVTRIRKELREKYGLFIISPLNKKSTDTQKILNSHRSTNERLPYYDVVYKQLFSYLEELGLSKQYTLLDLACGYNPFSYSYLSIKPASCVVSDLSSSDMSFIQSYFDQNDVSGKAIAFDLLSKEFEDWIQNQSFDVCFLFKALDSLEMVKRHSSKKLLANLPVNFVVVSFALQSIGGNKSIAATRRSWFEQFVQKQNWEVKTYELPNELFYIIKK